MATLAIQAIARAGVIPAYAAAAGGGDRFLPGPRTFVHIKNGGGGSITATVTTTRTDSYGNAVTDNAIAVGAGAEKMIGPFPAEAYGAVADGLADIAYTGVTTVTVGVFEVTAP